ncbi:MAG: hypothetical protein UY18_C0025G0002 [Microgenomates group bacterium GW2011_GWF2_47_9]|nr:MAG: hypothetical protein UY18_C0025G0002 [Microgenomates group bacterium GW2011_GWF2_47_9]
MYNGSMLNLFTQNYLTRGFWGDEAWTAGISRLPIKEIITITGQDFHPPFYYFLVHFFGGLFDFQEVPVRLISTFYFLLIPIIVYCFTQMFWATKTRPSRLASLVSAVLVLLSPILFTYAFEARSYALLAFESILSAYIFWRAKDEPRWTWRILYFLLGAIMVYTHYYAWFILASHAIYLLLFERKKILPLLLPALGILAVQLPWFPTLFGQTNSVKGSYWIGPINSRTHLEFFLRVTGGDVTTDWQKPLAYLVGLTVLFGFLYQLSRKKLAPQHKFLLTWLLVPTLIPSLISFVFMPVFFYRYLIFSAIPLTILVVQTVLDLDIKHRLRNLLLIGLAVSIAYLQIRVDHKIFAQYPRTMREAVNEMYETKQAGDGPVYTVLPSFAEVLYYVGEKDQIIVIPEGLVQFSGKSLLDAYVRLGKVIIAEPIESQYWRLDPGPTTTLIDHN